MPADIGKFIKVITLFVFSLLLIPVVGYSFHEYVGYVIFIVFVIELPLLVVMSRDALAELNSTKSGSKLLRILVRIIASIPSLIFGLTSITIGVGIVGWVLYNIFVERQPEYTGWVLLPSFGIGPALVYWGYSNLKSVLGLDLQQGG